MTTDLGRDVTDVMTVSERLALDSSRCDCMCAVRDAGRGLCDCVV